MVHYLIKRGVAVSRVVFSLMIIILLVISLGCERQKIDTKVWRYSGTDINRDIEHYYNAKEINRLSNDIAIIKTRGVYHKDKNAVEHATGVKNALYFETKMEMNCSGKYVRVMLIEYIDRNGSVIKRDELEKQTDTIRPINEKMPLYKAYMDICTSIQQ